MSKTYQGVDIVKISRFKKLLEERVNLICSAKKDPSIHYAGRFAAKEAGLKALGIGLSGIDHTLKEIEILSRPSGRPVIQLRGWAKKISRKKGISQLTVSISHSADYAVSTVIMTGE
jgi:holo-[acyl-carrier protein] synthase